MSCNMFILCLFFRYYGKANVHAMREFIPAVIHLSHERVSRPKIHFNVDFICTVSG